MSKQWIVACPGGPVEVDPEATTYTITGDLLVFHDEAGTPYAAFKEWFYFWAEVIEE